MPSISQSDLVSVGLLGEFNPQLTMRTWRHCRGLDVYKSFSEGLELLIAGRLL